MRMKQCKSRVPVTPSNLAQNLDFSISLERKYSTLETAARRRRATYNVAVLKNLTSNTNT